MTHIGRIKIVKEAEDIFDCICICPHCGKEARYGSMSTVSGVNCCPECNAELYDTILFDKKAHYDAYVRKANNNEYEPYKWEAPVATEDLE